MKLPGAGMLTVALVITANLQARCYLRNQMKSSAPPFSWGSASLPVKNRICLRHRPFPIFIAINSQLQETTREIRLHGMAE
jgi:hypothetical protein